MKGMNETVELMLILMSQIHRYKAMHVNKHFKVNAAGFHALSQRQFQILLCIGYMDVHTLSDMNREQSLSDGSFSVVLSKLVRDGFLYKKYPGHDDDKRKIYFFLTEKGNGVLAQFTGNLMDSLEAFCLSLNDAQQKDLKLGCEKINSLLSDSENAGLYIGSEGIQRASREMADGIFRGMFNLVSWGRHYFNKEIHLNRKCALTATQCRLLMNIDAFEICTIAKLAQVMHLTESTVSTSISKLAEEGYLVKKHPEANGDGRKIYFFLTESGRKTLLSAKEYLHGMFRRYIHTLQHREREDLCIGVKALCRVFSSLEESEKIKWEVPE